MRNPTISGITSINALAYLGECWQNSHPQIPNATLPASFQFTIDKHSSCIVQWSSCQEAIVNDIPETHFMLTTYEALLQDYTNLVPYEPTITAVTQILNYIQRKRQSYFYQASHLYYPRYQLCHYFCQRLTHLAQQSIESQLIYEYKKEIRFLGQVSIRKDQYLPTSTFNFGRNGLHSLLIDINLALNKIVVLIHAQLGHETLKQKTDRLQGACHTIIFYMLTRGAYIFSEYNFQGNFVLTDFISKHWAYPEFDQHLPAQWIKQLFQIHQSCYEQDDIKLCENNWLTQMDDTLAKYIAKQNPHSDLQKKPQTMMHYIKYFGLILELIYLHKLLQQITLTAGRFGDFQVVFNPYLFTTLENAISCWQSLSQQCQVTTNILCQFAGETMSSAPAATTPWVINQAQISNINTQLSEHFSRAQNHIQDIQQTCANLKKCSSLGSVNKPLTMHALSHTLFKRQQAAGLQSLSTDQQHTPIFR